MKVERDSRRVVIDTNAWISAALSPPGAPAQVVRRVLQHGLVVLTTRTYAELETRLWKPKFDPYLSIEVRQQSPSSGGQVYLRSTDPTRSPSP